MRTTTTAAALLATALASIALTACSSGEDFAATHDGYTATQVFCADLAALNQIGEARDSGDFGGPDDDQIAKAQDELQDAANHIAARDPKWNELGEVTTGLISGDSGIPFGTDTQYQQAVDYCTSHDQYLDYGV
ncbi:MULTISPECIES: hypothetical protein [Streptomyces]|uniref:hypothetical protein n=1 Tax=Streptomyces TaxID=1883 RepID=UPI00403D10F0